MPLSTDLRDWYANSESGLDTICANKKIPIKARRDLKTWYRNRWVALDGLANRARMLDERARMWEERVEELEGRVSELQAEVARYDSDGGDSVIGRESFTITP